jgi:adhesin transport system outer membrane protein
MSWLWGLILCIAVATPARALDMDDMLIDSISAHPEVKEKIHVYRQVVSDQRIASSGWRPSVDLQASTGSFETESPATGNTSTDYDSSSVELSLTQNLFNGYSTTYQVEQTEALARAALFDVYDTADNLALRAIQAYLDVLRQRRLYTLAQENVAAHERILAQIRDRNQSGVGRRSQLQQTEGRLARAQASLVAQLNNLEDAASRLHEILGRYVDPWGMTPPSTPRLPADSLDMLIDLALSGHPAMRVAESNVLAAQSEHRRSLSTRYPNLDLRLATEHGDDLDGIPGATDETSVTLVLTYNLYRGGRDSAEQQKRISAVYEQKEFAARVRRQVINTLRLAWIADTSLTRQLSYLQTHVIKSGETVESYREEFFIGQRDLLDLLDAENELNSARNQYAVARFDALEARYRVYEGIGILFEGAGVDFQLDEGRLRVARLDTAVVDELPIPVDEDADRENDPMDHCDNSLRGLGVNEFGCREEGDLGKLKPQAFKSNTPPVPADDVFEIDSGGILIITLQQLIANDTDADEDPLEVVEVSQPKTGRLAFNRDKNLVYRSTEDFSGTDSFEYTVTDTRGASVTATATVRIRVRQPENIDLDRVQLLNFEYDRVDLTRYSRSKVSSIIEHIRDTRDVEIDIYTHTDSTGSDAYNLALSQRRANALRQLLVQSGIDPARIHAVGKGETSPIADNSTSAGQAINRRAELIFKSGTDL